MSHQSLRTASRSRSPLLSLRNNASAASQDVAPRSARNIRKMQEMSPMPTFDSHAASGVPLGAADLQKNGGLYTSGRTESTKTTAETSMKTEMMDDSNNSNSTNNNSNNSNNGNNGNNSNNSNNSNNLM
eukprot:TRINITY_DN4804_c0_g1_i2.p2 TRINITY_DN4804_c0_g1~~TRINITY_DN4804_c0_g1_i2.p2  ORF type:complete len:129 (-),score=30.75 TRINITY_DN4804_c0_g1_i2:175-561(-)